MSALDPHKLGLRPERGIRCTALWIALSAAWLATLALAGCHSPSSRATAPEHAPPPNAQEPEDASYDWHALLVAPFGSVLKEIPLTLHEVLLFKDEAHAGAKADDAAADAECYAADSPGPRFVGRTPDEYLLCFRQDRLSRIQASVLLPTAQAPGMFAAACARWLKNAAATGRTEPPNAAAPSATVPSGSDCVGRDGPVRFSGRLGEESGRPDVPQTDGPAAETTLSITLDSAPAP
jgi:hypothetical protein